MKEIVEYMTASRDERRFHLDLTTQCSEIGGLGSIEYKGLLAYFLGTKIPTRQGQRVQLCHACGNGKCSNVLHLYWGTAKDNYLDQVTHGTMQSLYHRTLKKYGAEGIKKIAIKAGKASGLTNKHKKTNEYWEQFRPLFESEDLSRRGWPGRIAKKMNNVSPTHVRRVAKRLGFLN